MSKARNIADLGSNDVLDTTASGVDVTGTITTDALSQSNTTGAAGVILNRNFSGDVSSYTNTPDINFTMTDTGTSDQVIASITPQAIGGVGDAFGGNFRLNTANTSGTEVKRISVDENGDIIMYKDDGSTAGVIFDASSGDFFVGKSGTTLVAGHGLLDDGTLQARRDIATANSSSVGYISRGSTDGNILTFYKDTTSIGSIATRDTGALEIGSGDVYLQFNGSNDWIKPVDGSGNNKSGVDLGTSGARFKDLYLSSGIENTGGNITLTVPETAGAAVKVLFGDSTNSTRRTVEFYKDQVRPALADTGTIDLGSSNQKFKHLYLSGGVKSSGGDNIFNDDGGDIDFRVESSSKTHAFFVDGGNSNVGVNIDQPIAYGAHIRGQGREFTDTIWDPYNENLPGANTRDVSILYVESDSAAAANYGSSIGFRAKAGNTVDRVTFATIAGVKENQITDGSNSYSDQVKGCLDFYTSEAYSFSPNYGSRQKRRMRIDSSGYVTTPYQPSWNLRPNTSSDVTHTNDIIGWTTNTTGSSNQVCHIRGVTLTGSSSGVANASNSGRITVPVTGVYKVWITHRYENTPGAGNIYLKINGTTRARQHVEVWGRYNYAHGFMSQIVKLSAGDYIEWNLVNTGNGSFSGYNDTVNWCGGYLIG